MKETIQQVTDFVQKYKGLAYSGTDQQGQPFLSVDLGEKTWVDPEGNTKKMDELRPQVINDLADLLKADKTVAMLKLEPLSQLGDKGAIALAYALKGNTTLRRLDLRCNEIGIPGAITLAYALKANSTLETLELGSNKIETAGAMFLADSLTTNATLQYLDLRHNNITNQWKEEVRLAKRQDAYNAVFVPKTQDDHQGKWTSQISKEKEEDAHSLDNSSDTEAAPLRKELLKLFSARYGMKQENLKNFFDNTPSL